jgi:GR25 family glycosyltransferase involved in LPS biosynthesis
MNLSSPLRAAARCLYAGLLKARLYLPRRRCPSFHKSGSKHSGISSIYVINLDRQPGRMTDMLRELDRLTDVAGTPLANRVIRFSAVDGQSELDGLTDRTLVTPTYTLGDQLFVEPQPHAAPDLFDLNRPIKMTRAEIAIACSHIGVWRAVAQSDEEYALVLEDDVWFEHGFGQTLDCAWREATSGGGLGSPSFDILYVSYQEVRYGAPKDLIGRHVFRPQRGLWFLSGYILSKRGAQKLLSLLPCQGPVDLWINHKFADLSVLGLRRSLVHQRRDLHSTNSYSILPSLAQIGVLENGGESLFHRRPIHSPVFAFGSPGSGLSSLAMALSMLGYRCCSDFNEIPEVELELLMAGDRERVFDAYVNVESLTSELSHLRETYPDAKFIWLGDSQDHVYGALVRSLKDADVLHLTPEGATSWRAICEHLRMAPPDAPYPCVDEIGLRKYIRELQCQNPVTSGRQLRSDPSPWVVRPRSDWEGISSSAIWDEPASTRMHLQDDFTRIQPRHWLLRNDTFPGNLGLFRPSNVTPSADRGLVLSVFEEPLGVRGISAAAISSRTKFLFGRFEATLKAASARGIVTGFFLHRNSPRQEIDIEILGNQPDCLLVNVFYNPGGDGAKFDYGYRGTPKVIKLGFDASKSFHRYAIEWDPCEIRWFVDDHLVHRRVTWNPTPIPHLPMTLHVNIWPSRSAELAGRLALRELPVSAFVKRVSIEACDSDGNHAKSAEPEGAGDAEKCPSI